jgi:hypothetical protein
MSRQTLLWLLLPLAFIRFGLFPIWDWQAEQKQKLQQAAQHQAKVEQMLAQFTELEQQQLLSEQYTKEAVRLFPRIKEVDYRLKLQQQVQQLLNEQQVQMQVFDWVNVQQADSSLFKANINLRLTGTASRLAMVHALLEQMPNVKIDNFNLTWFGMLNPDAELNANFDFSVYFSSEETNV